MEDYKIFLQDLLSHLDYLSKKTIFMLGMEYGRDKANDYDNVNNVNFENLICSKTVPRTQKESKEDMLIDLKGVSISTKQRKDGRYQGYLLQEGEKKYFYGKTTDDVKTKIESFLKKDQKNKNKTAPTFDKYVAEWLEKYKKPNLKIKSFESAKQAVKKAVEHFKGKNILKITTDDLQSFLTSMPQSRSRDLCYLYLGQIFKKAYTTGIIKKNPFEFVEIKKEPLKKKNALTKDEQERFLKAAEHSKHYLLYRFLLSTGLRIGEALALNPKDFSKGKVTVSKDIVFDKGQEILQTPKTKASHRAVPVPSDIYEKIAKIKTERTFPLTYTGVCSAFKKLSKKLGFKVSAHLLRHTYATRLEEAGISPKIKQYLLGHANMSITQDVYTDIQEDFLNSKISEICDVFNPQKTD